MLPKAGRRRDSCWVPYMGRPVRVNEWDCGMERSGRGELLRTCIGIPKAPSTERRLNIWGSRFAVREAVAAVMGMLAPEFSADSIKSHSISRGMPVFVAGFFVQRQWTDSGQKKYHEFYIAYVRMLILPFCRASSPFSSSSSCRPTLRCGTRDRGKHGRRNTRAKY